MAHFEARRKSLTRRRSAFGQLTIRLAFVFSVVAVFPVSVAIPLVVCPSLSEELVRREISMIRIRETFGSNAIEMHEVDS